MRFAAPFCLCFVVAAVDPSFAQEPNDSFATAISAGSFAVTDSLNGGGPHPDTLLAVFDDAEYLTVDTSDDDSSPWGDGFASAVGPVSVQTNGEVYIGVTGSGDYEFVGDHDEQGLFYIQVDVYDPDDFLIDFLSADRQLLEAGEPLFYTVGDPSWAGGTAFVTIDNQVDTTGPDQFDFWRFSGLDPGVAFSAEITAGEFDSIIGWFNEGGDLIAFDDDSGDGKLSKLSGVVPASGDVVVAVTGYNVLVSEPFTGNHPQVGTYTLAVDEIDVDFNDDGEVNCLDIDGLVIALGSESEEDPADVGFDLNGDGRVGQQDITTWLAAASTHNGPLLPGDANLDGFVDGSDFNVWNDHRSADSLQGWCQGNFNADLNVDDLDLDIWMANRFNSSAALDTAAPVPEPSGLTWMTLACVAGLARVLKRSDAVD